MRGSGGGHRGPGPKRLRSAVSPAIASFALIRRQRNQPDDVALQTFPAPSSSPNPLVVSFGTKRSCPAREARRARELHIGLPKALHKSKAVLAQRMHASGEPVSVIGKTLGASRATVYRVLAEQTGRSARGGLTAGSRIRCQSRQRQHNRIALFELVRSAQANPIRCRSSGL